MRRSSGFTLVEVLIIVVLMSIVASVVVVQFSDMLAGTELDVARHSRSQLRAHIERYQAAHGGQFPSATLVELVQRTNQQGQVGTSLQHRYGPYVSKIPVNPLTRSDRVESIDNSPPVLSDVQPDAGWLYNPKTGEIWISHPDYFTE